MSPEERIEYEDLRETQNMYARFIAEHVAAGHPIKYLKSSGGTLDAYRTARAAADEALQTFRQA